jgi:hypothetical protein
MQSNWHTSDENPAMAIRCKAGKIDDDESGQRESNPHGQLGRLELYH